MRIVVTTGATVKVEVELELPELLDDELDELLELDEDTDDEDELDDDEDELELVVVPSSSPMAYHHVFLAAANVAV